MTTDTEVLQSAGGAAQAVLEARGGLCVEAFDHETAKCGQCQVVQSLPSIFGIEAASSIGSTNFTTYQTLVTQKGGSATSSDWRTRSTTFDALGRTLSISSPEAGTSNFTYGTCLANFIQVCSKTDARGVVSTFSYDALNRLTNTTYTTSGTTAAPTPSVSYSYDQSSYNGLSISNGNGKRTGMSDGTGATAWSYGRCRRA